MKKITPYIFIALILVNLFAPFTVGMDKVTKAPTIQKSEAEAGDIGLTLMGKSTKTTIELKFKVARFKETTGHGMVYMVTDKYGTSVIGNDKTQDSDYLVDLVTASYTVNKVSGLLFKPADGAQVIAEGKFSIGGDDVQDTAVIILKDRLPNTTYYVSYAGFNGNADDAFTIEPDTSVKTKSADEADDDQFYELSSSSGGGFLPACVWGFIKVNVAGCIAQLLYAALFQPTAYLFGLAGKFFDFTFFYSVSDNSYRTSFVIEGWGLVRDFANIFFIFVLLWIAFSTILNVHGFKTKEMVMNVVIIGLLINFSMFATQVIIDTSNILARVFYNSITAPQKNANDPSVGVNGETKISEQIVGFANPQKLIAKANRVGVITRPGDQASNTGSNSYGLSNGTFILVTLLATVVNVVGIFVFVSVGLIFVARVLGLWLAVIFVPLAFFSYTVPGMQTIDMIGWKKWWPDTLKMAFLAPVFIFFMYLIVKFLGADSFFSAIKGESGPEFIISVIFPFAFVMILMMKAKTIASKLAGDIGTGVTKAAIAGGSAAIAGGALTAAFAGRRTMGSISNHIQNDSKRNKDAKLNSIVPKGWSKANPLAWAKGVGNFASANIAKVPHNITNPFSKNNIAVNRVGQPQTTRKRTWGESMQSSVQDVKDKSHAEHELNEVAQKVMNDKDAKYKDLDEPEAKKVRDTIDRDIIAKSEHGKTWDRLDASQKSGLELNHKVTGDPDGEWSQSAESIAHANGGHAANSMAKSLKADVAIGEFVRSLQKGSYDIRDLSNIKKSGNLTGLAIGLAPFLGAALLPIGIALAASTSSAIKKGLKAATGGVDHGSAQKDFLKDLSHTINTALSHMKIDVKVDAGGGGDHGHAKASGGGGHH